MKLNQLTYIIGLSLVLGACEVIPENERIETVQPVVSEQRVLLTEFTGYKCVNCPLAAEVAHTLLETYPENVVVVAMHPASNSFTDPGDNAANDHRSEEADKYYQYFGGTAQTSFPKGVVNWSKQNGMYLNDYTLWTASVTKELEKTPQLSIALNCMSKTSEQAVSIEATVNGLGESTTANLILLITEDGVIGEQATTTGEIHDYEHNHILRKAITDIWGDGLEPLEAGKSITRQYAYGFEGSGWNMNNCNIVGILIDPDTKEVINCVEVPVVAEVLPTVEFTLLTVEGDTIHDGDTLRVEGREPMLKIAGKVLADQPIKVSVECVPPAQQNDQMLCSGMLCMPSSTEYDLSAGDWYTEYNTHNQVGEYIIDYTFHDPANINRTKVTMVFECVEEGFE